MKSNPRVKGCLSVSLMWYNWHFRIYPFMLPGPKSNRIWQINTLWRLSGWWCFMYFKSDEIIKSAKCIQTSGNPYTRLRFWWFHFAHCSYIKRYNKCLITSLPVADGSAILWHFLQVSGSTMHTDQLGLTLATGDATLQYLVILSKSATPEVPSPHMQQLDLLQLPV